MIVVSLGPYLVCKTVSRGVAKATVDYLTAIGWAETAIEIRDRGKVIKIEDLQPV